MSSSWSTVSLVVDDVERWGPLLSLGALGVVVAQLPQAADRAERGERAVVRAGVFDTPDALFLVLEPGQDHIVLTIGISSELSDPIWLPTGTRIDTFYAMVDEHHQMLVSAGKATGIAPQALPRRLVVTALRREFELGNKAIALLGEGSY